MHISTTLQSSYYWLAHCVWTVMFTLVPMVLHWKTNPLGPTLIVVFQNFYRPNDLSLCRQTTGTVVKPSVTLQTSRYVV